MTYTEHTCPEAGCGVPFQVTDGFDARRREDHRTFYCPNGHSMSFTGKSDKQKLVDVTAQLMALKVAKAHDEATLNRLRNKVKRLAKRKA